MPPPPTIDYATPPRRRRLPPWLPWLLLLVLGAWMIATAILFEVRRWRAEREAIKQQTVLRQRLSATPLATQPAAAPSTQP